MTGQRRMASTSRRTALAQRRAAAALLLATGILTAGCGSARASHQGVTLTPAPPSLATSLVTAAGTWAVVPMGGSPAFWQLVRYPAVASQAAGWSLVTPPGVADNGGLVLADLGGQSLLAGFRPSKSLSYSPLATTADGGTTWSAGILDAPLADVPDALAASADGHLLALLADGTAEESVRATGTPGWSRVTSERALAVTAGQKCGLVALTAAAFSAPGIPLLAGNCARPGTAGIFAERAGSWRAAGPALPTSLAGAAVTALRLATSRGRTVALLAAGTGRAANLLAGWTSGSGAHWTLAPPLALAGAQVQTSGLGAGGGLWVMLADGRAETLSGPGGSWRALPALPPGTAALAMGLPGQFDALAAHGTTLTGWRLDAGGTRWHSTQKINVPIQFGSSG